MNLIPVDGTNVLSRADPDDIVLGSAPPSPTLSEQAQAPHSPPLPPIPPAEQPLAGASGQGAPLDARQQQRTAPHVASQAPSDNLASSLQQLSGEAAFLPRSAVERTPSNTFYGGQGINPDLALRPQATAMSRTASEDAELYIPGLTSASLFVMLPKTDSLTPIIDKYLPPNQRPTRDLSGNWRGRSLEQLTSSRSWRAVAEYCHDSIMSAAPEQTSHLLSLWSLRLQALLRLHLFDHLTTELSALFALLPPSSYLSLHSLPPSPETPLFHPAVPFELHVLLATLHGLRGDQERTVESLAAILRSVKEELWAARRRGDKSQEGVWQRRAKEIGGLLTGVLTRLKTSSSAASLLSSSSPTPTSTLLQALTRLHISTGDLLGLSQTTAALSSLPGSESSSRSVRKARGLEKVAKGEWAEAASEWRKLVEEDGEDAEARNNLAVVLLFSCKLDEAIEVLKGLLTAGSGFASETVLFNLATLLELRTEANLSAKLDLLRGAVRHGGEGLRGSCLKLAV